MANTPQLYVDENTLGLELGTSLDLARKAPVKPDDEAALRAASKRLNIPLDSARTLPQQTKELAQQAAFDPTDYAKRFPNSAKFLANQDNARLAVDDVEPLSAVEQATVNLIRQRMEPTALNPLAAAVQRLMPERAAAEEEVRKTLREQGFAAASAKRREVEQRLGALQPTGTIQATQGPAPSVGSVLSGMGTSLTGGARQARISGQLAVNDLFNALGAKPNDVYTKDLIRKYDQETGRIADSVPAFETSTGRGLYAGAQSLAQQAPALAVSVATGSTIPALAAAGLNTAGEAYGRYRSRGGSAGEAALGAGGEAVVEILTEKLPMKFVVDNLGKAGFGQFLRGFIGRELATEQVATVLQDAIDTAVANPNKTWAEYWAERPDAAYQTALATIVQGGAMGAINTVLTNTVGKAEMARQEAERAAMSAAGLEQLLAAAAQSQTRVRAPESFSQLVQQSAVQGGALTEVYFDAQPFVDALEQSGLTPEQIETLLPSVRDNLAEAVATNGTVMVPIGEMVTAFAGTGVEQALLQQARTEPDALSVADTAQAQALTEQLQQDAEQVLAQQEQRKAWDESAKQVYDTMLGQLNTAGRFSNDVNKAQATITRDFYTVMASRLGTTPAELYQRYPLRATATLPGGRGDVLEQSVDLTPPEAAETGKPMRVYFARNTVSSKKHAPTGMDFGQKLEPAGEYMVVEDRDMSDQGGDGWVYGAITFRNPLVLEHKSTNSTGWKKDLSEMFGGKTGKALSNAVKKAGYDGIVTRDSYGYSEVVNLSGVKGETLNQSAQPSDLQRALAMSEDDYIAAINPTGETNTEDGSARLVRGDLSDPVDAEVVRQLDGGVTIERDAEGNFYARQGGDTIGEIINYGDEVNVNVLPEARGKGVAVNLAAEFMRVNPFFNAGSLTPGGEAVVRAAHRMLKGEVLNQSAVQEPPAQIFDDEFESAADVFAAFERGELLVHARRKDGTDFAYGIDPANGDFVQGLDSYAAMVDNDIDPPDLTFFSDNESPVDTWAKYFAKDGSPVELVFVRKNNTLQKSLGDGRVRTADGAEVSYERSPLADYENPALASEPTFVEKGDWYTNKSQDVVAVIDYVQQGEVLNQSAPQTETEAFKRWFGDSKVREPMQNSKQRFEDMAPLVVYHGTGADFDTFEPVRDGVVSTTFGENKVRRSGIFFAENANFASTFAGQDGGTGANVMPVYLRIRNPLYLDEGFTDEIRRELADNGLADAEQLRYVKPLDVWAALDDVLGEALVKAAKAAGYDGIYMQEEAVGLGDDVDPQSVWVAFDPEQIKSTIGNRGTFDPADPNILNQSQIGERNLIVAHNLSAENVRHAVEIGGLAAPSLAITKAETPIQGFGEITLIGDTSLAKPSAKNPVFDADVYSPRFPDVKVKVDEKRVRKVFGPLVEAAQAAGVDTRGIDRMIEEMQRNRLGNAVGDVAYDNGLRWAYVTQVKGEAFDIPMKDAEVSQREVNPRNSLIATEPLASVLAGVDVNRVDWNSAESGQIAQALYSAMVNKFTAEAKAAGRENPDLDGFTLANRRINVFADVDENNPEAFEVLPGVMFNPPVFMKPNGLKRIADLLVNTPESEMQRGAAPKQVIDRDALDRQLSERAPDEEIRTWAREQLAPAMGEKRIVKENGRTAEYTLDNVVKEMTRKVRDSEGFNYGLGNARSRGATRFKSLAQIQGQRDRVIGKEDSDAAIAENKKLYEAMLNDLLPYHPASKERYGRSAWEALPDAIGESYTIGMDRALKENGFVDVPAEMVDRVKQFASDLVQLPTEYFEAKPQRAVGLSEFRAAVVPSNLPEDVRQALTDSGLELVEYTKGDEQSRAEAVSGIATRLDVLFQGEQARATFKPATLNIALLEKADLSSFLHELGHFYFEVLADIASQPNAPQQIVDDMNTLLRMAGFEGTAAEWLQQPINARRDAHEMVAESFEQYLFDGKAPSLEQQALFSRLRAWMVSVYRTIAQFLQTNKNAQLTDEVRGVFDRMLATDAQIEAARAARSFGPMFESAEQAGMTPEQFEQYKAGVQQETDDATRDLDARRLRDMRWLQNYRSKKLRELQKDAKAKRQAMLDEVTAEVDAQRAYQTLAFIRSGKLPDGTAKPEGMASTRLNRGIIEAMYGEQFKVPDALLSRDGVDPEIVASLFGYASADQMVREVANAEPRKELIAGMTDQRMLERYGDLASAEAIERAADAAIANDAHARMVSTELAAVTKQLGSVQAISRAARDFAERSTGGKAIKYLRPDQAAADAARQRKAAEQALKKGETAAAADAKRNELLAIELQRAQTKAKEEIVKARNDMRRLWGKDEQKAKTRDMNLVNAARAVVAQYGIAPERAGEAATAYIEKVAAYDAELAANLTAMMSQAPAAKPFKDLTVDEFRAVRDVVQSLYYMSKRSKEIEIDGKKVQLDAVADDLTNRLLDLSGGELPPLAGVESTATKWDHLKVGALGVRAMGTRVEQWADRLGPQFTQYIWNPVSEAVTRYRAKRNDMVGKYRDLLKQVASGLTYRPIYAPELGAAGFTFNHGKVEILHALLHSGNPSNLRKLLLGRGWATVDESGILDTRNWDRFVARAINEGIITKADYDFAQGVWDLLETTKVDAQRAHLEMYGYYFNEVTAQPIQTPFGEYRGGYVPAVADPISAPDAAQKREMEDMNAVGNSYMFPTTGKGFTQARVEYNRPLMLDLRTLSSHIDKVTRFSYIEPTIRDVANLLNAKKTPRFANALNRYDQGAIAKMLIPWLQRTAQQTTSLTGKDRYVDAFFRGLRSRSGMYLMFANVVNTLQQLTGFSVAALKVPAPMLLRAAYRYIQAPKRTAAEAAAISPWLAQRQSNQAFEMTQQINDILIDPNLYQKADAFVKKHAYFMQTALQNVMDTVVWTGAYDNALAKGADPKQAMRYADEAVRTTQGTFAPEDVSAMEVQTPFVQLFTQFWGYFNMLANTLGAESNKAIRDMGYMASTRRLAFIWFAGLALPAFVAELIASGAPDDEDDEDGDGVLDEWLAMFFGSQGRTLTAMVPVAGQAAQLVWNKLDAKWYNDKLNVSPALSLGDSAVSGVASILQGKAFDERLTKGEVREMATLIGLATGMPTNVAARPIGYMLDVEAGKQDPEGAGDVVWGLTTGR